MPDEYPTAAAPGPDPVPGAAHTAGPAPGADPVDADAAVDPTTVFAAFCEAALWPGLGRTTAARLPAAGITRPEHVDLGRLGAVEGVTGPRARRLADSFRAAAGTYAVVELLVAADLPARLARGATERLGPTAAEALRADPWMLLTAAEAEIGQADRFARRRGLRRDDPRRGPAVLTHLLGRAATRAGDTAGPVDAVLQAAAREGVADPHRALDAALDDGRIIAVGDRIALERYAMAEQSIVDGIERLVATAEPLRAGAPRVRRRPDEDDDNDDDDGSQAVAAAAGPPPTALMFDDEDAADDDPPSGGNRATGDAGPDGTSEAADAGGPTGPTGLQGSSGGSGDDPVGGLDEVQLAAARAALESGVSVLTGGPGTGKSRTVAAVVRLAWAADAEVALAAPTGRAAKRLEELCGAPASTLHRLLGAQGRGGGFARGEHNPIDADLVVVDEASMLDAELAAALLDACAEGTHLMFVGDPAQLPSIGPGQVLTDLLESGEVPVTELRRLYRQVDGGAIALMAAAVRGGELPPPPPGPGREVVVVPSSSSGEAAHRTVQLVTDSIPRALGIPVADIQVVTPVHAGPAGTGALNAALKRVLNPGAGAVSGFDVGDRVVATANHIDVGFANGEIGTVVAAGERGALRVAFPGGVVEVPAGILGDLRHGWAVTVHRAQGSEWPAVVAVFPPEAGRMLTRPLIYTALTRAATHLSIVAVNGPAVRHAVRNAGGRRRLTSLAALLAGEIAGQLAEDDEELDDEELDGQDSKREGPQHAELERAGLERAELKREGPDVARSGGGVGSVGAGAGDDLERLRARVAALRAQASGAGVTGG
ncbi:AAA family ATPase [Frankia sp. ACN1ag]|uniref:AAA family ATPase n=1 Tax=Frankia sp. ACN1ag TaxID=102891 RepID=UPI000707B15C|nr:AAA family ATPase [Frankia sp. ACN1ag]KQC36831.1 exodeoxyribonuclease V [Frankia sp. ACN1ag]